MENDTLEDIMNRTRLLQIQRMIDPPDDSCPVQEDKKDD